MDSRTGEIDESLDGDDVDPREAFLEDILFTQGIHHKFESLQKFINHEGIETGKVIDKSTTE